MPSLIRFIGTAAQFYQPAAQAYAALHVRSSYNDFRIAPSPQTAWVFGGNIIGVIGTQRVLEALFKYGLKLAIKASLADQQIGEKMVDDMKGRVPKDTGKLLNGIKMEKESDLITVSASAIDERDGEDYAMFVEFGTGDNGKVADDSFFNDGTDAGIVFHSGGRHHAATPAEPFFWDAARDGLAKHRELLEQAAQPEDF